MSPAGAELHEVRIVGLPLDLQARAQEQHAELVREFALLEISAPTARNGEAVPVRLIALSEELSHSYGGIGAGADAERDAAALRGESSVDLVYQVPESVGEACDALSQMLDEADEFCREGDRLLTLAAPDDLVAFRHWYLSEFARQVHGGAPTSWPEYAAQHGIVVSAEPTADPT